MSKNQDRLSDQIRRVIDAGDMSRYAIAKAIGLDHSVMSRFMAGKSGLSIETLDRLAALLGLRVIADHSPRNVRKAR